MVTIQQGNGGIDTDKGKGKQKEKKGGSEREFNTLEVE